MERKELRKVWENRIGRRKKLGERGRDEIQKEIYRRIGWKREGLEKIYEY